MVRTEGVLPVLKRKKKITINVPEVIDIVGRTGH